VEFAQNAIFSQSAIGNTNGITVTYN